MDLARKTVRSALASSQSPAVLSSFGKDSMLLLALVREIAPRTPVIWFRDGTDESFARQVIREWGLTAFSPAPADAYLLANPTTDETTLIAEYDFGGDRLPMLTDLTPGTTCALTHFPHRTSLFYPFDLLLVGWKDTDMHWVKGNAQLAANGFTTGRAIVIAPIRHLTDEQVRAAIHTMNIPYRQVEDALPLCTACMTAKSTEVYCPEVGHNIPVHRWEADKSLTAFRQRFQLEGV